LVDYGIEGEHYAKRPDGTIGYPPGVSGANPPYVALTWMYGNQLISHVWEGNSPDLWDQMKVFNANAIPSPALGFTFNSTPVLSQGSALAAVRDQYRSVLETGSVDVSMLDEFNAKLKQAGLNEVIAEKQRQLDAWFAANGK
jgi:putative aldouronate transport system substrate-binding protein